MKRTGSSTRIGIRRRKKFRHQTICTFALAISIGRPEPDLANDFSLPEEGRFKFFKVELT